MTVVEQRHGITKHDVREHWREEMGKSLLGMLVLLLGQLLFVVPASIFDNWILKIVIQGFGFAIVWLFIRLCFCIYKYSGTLKKCRKISAQD